MKTFPIKLTDELHKELKAEAYKKEVSIQKLIISKLKKINK